MRPLLALSLLVGACQRPSTAPPDAGLDVLGQCHAADYVAPACDGPPPAQLASAPLAAGFFQDVFANVQLTGQYGRRVTFGDVDGDGFPDFIAVQTGVTPGLQHLYLNRPSPSGGRLFVDATASSGIQVSADGGVKTALMVAFADVDNDGDLDLFEGSYSQQPSGALYVGDPNALYLNDGSGHFTLAPSSGVDQPWPLTTAAAVFVDYDLDGKLDLFVGNFMIAYPDLTSYQNELYRGNGDGTFTRVTIQTGLITAEAVGAADGMYTKPTYGLTACDWNNDGWPDLLTSTYALGWNDLWQNLGNGTFQNAGQSSQYYMDSQAMPGEPMYRWGGNTFATACGDYDNDGDLDLMTAATTHGDYPRSLADRSRILVNSGAEGGWQLFRPEMDQTGINRDINGDNSDGGIDGESGDEGDHGVTWLDFDNDGLLDLVIEQSAYLHSHAFLYHQRPDHSFENVTPLSGVQDAMVNSNGLTVDDYDRDGDLDILMGSVNDSVGSAPGGVEQIHLFENEVGNRNHWLHVTLHGLTANRQGVGARVTVTAGCLTQMREIPGGKGTFGAADPAYAHFGLGQATRVDKLEVRWPTQPTLVQDFYNVAVDQFLEVSEGATQLACQGAAASKVKGQ